MKQYFKKPDFSEKSGFYAQALEIQGRKNAGK